MNKKVLSCILALVVFTVIAVGMKKLVDMKMTSTSETTFTSELPSTTTTTLVSKQVFTTLEATESTTSVTTKCITTLPPETTTTTTTLATEVVTTANSNLVTGFENEMLDQINALRVEVGAPELSFDSELTRLAQIRAEEISEKYQSDHRRPDGTAWHTVLNIDYTAAGENIAYGQKSVSEVMAVWSNSLTHYDNMVDEKYTHVGLGCYSKNGVLYWEQLFIGR